MTATVHAHRCEKCLESGKQTFWIHGDDKAGAVEAHKCPECGEIQWKKWMIETASLTKKHNHGGINLDAILGYLVLAVGVSLLAYGAYVYIKERRNKKELLP